VIADIFDMRIEVLRATAVCWFGNEHLFNADESRMVEVMLKSCFRGVERLEFVRPTAHHFSAPGAGFMVGTKMWFRRIKADGVESLRLHLPVSLLEPLPEAYGVVSDSSAGCDIWVQAPNSTARDVEYTANRFAAWSLPRLRPSADLAGQLGATVSALNPEPDIVGALVAERISSLAASLNEPSVLADGFEDCIPGEFSSHWRLLAARALRTVAVLGAAELELGAHPNIHRRVDEAWRLSLRLLEALSAEVAAERSHTSAA
jgi:hypothetical protein